MKKARTMDFRLLILAFIASALMLMVIQPPISWSLLAWVSLVPFILACSPEAKPKHLVVAAYIVSLCYWLGNLYWVFPITVAGWAAFCLYTAVLWPIAALTLRYCRIKKIPLFLASGAIFVGAERLQGFFLGGFFWRFLAHSQFQNITIIQIADIFGAAGVSFLIAMVNGLIAELILDARYCIKRKTEDRRQKTEGNISVHCPPSSVLRSLAKIVIVSSLLAASIFYGRWRINQSECIVDGPLVGSLQSNVPQSVKREAMRGQTEVAEQTSQAIFDELMQKSKEAAKAGAELIVWPETIVQATLNREILDLVGPDNSWKVFDRALRDHAKNNTYLLVGAFGGMPDATNTILAKKYNSAYLYKKDGTQYEKRYDKIHLVLFGEVLPFRKSFPLLFKLLMKFNPYGFDHSLDAGKEYTVFEMSDSRGKDYKFAVVICYEATIPAIARRFAVDEKGQKNIDWLINISNDGWFVQFKDGKAQPSTELPQHVAVCVFRAVENRLAVVRSVNTGISCVIDSLGRIKDDFLAGTLPSNALERKGMAGWFVDKLPIDKRVTFFSKHGQWLDFCCAVCFILLIIMQMTDKWLNRNWKMVIGNWKMENDNYQSPITNYQCTAWLTPLLNVLLFACISIFLIGCEEPPQTGTATQPEYSLGNLEPEATQIILAALSDADPQIRANAIEVVAATRQVKLMAKVQRLLQDEIVPVKFTAILAASDLQYRPAEGEIRQLLQNTNENVRIAAASAMTRFGHPEYLKLVRDAITSQDQTVRANAALLLGKSGNPDVLKLLYWALQQKDSSDKVRFQAIEAIAMLGDEQILPRIWAIVYSGYADDRLTGIRAMGALATTKAKDVLVTKLDDEVLEVRLAAAEQLGKFKDPIGEPEVLKVFTENPTAGMDKDEIERVKTLTALAIGQIGTESLKKFLPQLLSDESKSVRIAAAKAVFQSAIRK
ncbi:MAG: apolipoprotein N-acyltransferase [Sedimentisphaerales bacterium]|nr:apolipoprotein N-acyltransferase [Sedimentisphaerales bacterium]